MANEAQTAFDEAAPEAAADAAREAAAELQSASPVRTGALRGSIRSEGEFIVMNNYGVWQNYTHHRGWIERATGGELTDVVFDDLRG